MEILYRRNIARCCWRRKEYPYVEYQWDQAAHSGKYCTLLVLVLVEGRISVCRISMGPGRTLWENIDITNNDYEEGGFQVDISISVYGRNCLKGGKGYFLRVPYEYIL